MLKYLLLVIPFTASGQDTICIKRSKALECVECLMNRATKDSIITLQEQQITDLSAINTDLRQAVVIAQDTARIESNKRKLWQWLTGGVAVLGAVMYLTKD
jgi:hypothetical protein